MIGLYAIPILLAAGFLLDAFFNNDDTDNDENDASTRSTFKGTEDDDILEGTEINDLIQGYDGNDSAKGLAGNDVIRLGAGNDNARAGAGNDKVFGGEGNDVVFGQWGDDNVRLGSGNDVYGVDQMSPEIGDDFIHGGYGNDVITDTRGANTLMGGAGDDALNATDDFLRYDINKDELYGGAGDDLLVGDYGDYMSGGDGVDTYRIRVTAGLTDAPAAVIDGFVPADELLTIQVATDAETFSSSLALSEDASATNVVVDGTIVASIRGVTPEELGPSIAFTKA